MDENIQEQMEKRIEVLKKRVGRCVCKYCGGELKLRQIIFSRYEDARIECFCKNCNRIEYGVEPEIYSTAKYFVEKTKFNCYQTLDDNARTRQMTIAKICEILMWQNQRIGILTPNGYTIDLKLDENYVEDGVVFSDEDLKNEVQI